jgi:hypothetical protein
MNSGLDQLLGIASPPIAQISDVSAIPPELSELAKRRNGFYAFESSLHVFPCGSGPAEVMTLEAWNEDDLWKSTYKGMTDGLYFFAEDIFGGQFALGKDGIISFEPETGESRVISADLNSWASEIMSNYSVLVGWPIARDWQRVNGPIRPGQRLVPKKPFVLGGEYAINNLYALDATASMRLRGEIAVQIRDLPDGTTVTFTKVE